MRSAVYSVAALPLAAQALSFLDDNRFVQQSGLLRYPITVSGGAPAKSMRKRQDSADLTPQKSGFFYTIEIAIGTPAETVSVNFDTGSSELWVNPVCSKSTDPEFCETFGRYTESTTFVDTKAAGGVKYGTGYVDFEYGYDFVQIGSAKISQQVFGVATDSEFASVGILGVGPDLGGWDSPYPYVIDNLATQGFTNSRAFSLDIRSIGSDRGSVIFGGIDTKKFSGHLEKRPIIPAKESPDGYTRYWIYLDGMTVTKEDGTTLPVFDKPNGQPVLLDSGYTISTLPGPIFEKVLEAFPSAKQDSGSDEYTVDCNIGNTNGAVNFKFGETIISVPYNDFIWKQPEHGICKLGVARDDEFPVLGDTFLRAAYVVYDWDNRNIHLANNEDCGSSLLPIGKGPDAVPSVVGACGAATTTSTSAPVTTSEPAVTATEPATTESPATFTSDVSSSGVYNTTLTVPTTSSHQWYNTSAPVYTTTAAPTLTSTFTTTRTYTITSCAPTITNCPVGHVTTEIITSYTTYCPGEGSTPAPKPTTTSSSPCPEITATFTIPRTYTCSKGQTTCASQTPVHVITVSPVVTQTAPVTVPHCTTCAPVIPTSSAIEATPILTHPTGPVATGPAVSSPASPPAVTYPAPTPAPTPIPTGGLTTVVTPCKTCGPASTHPAPPAVTAGAAEMFRAPAIAAIVAGVLAAALL